MQIEILSIRDIEGASLNFQLSAEPDQFDDDDVVSFDSSIHVTGKVTNLGVFFLVSARVKGEVRVCCDRCLEAYSHSVDEEMESRYVSFRDKPSVDMDDCDELTDNAGDLRVFHGTVIDITDEVRETILLRLPYKLVCSSECKGICPQCGVNRNDHECDCADRDIDPRLADLANLLKKEP